MSDDIDIDDGFDDFGEFDMPEFDSEIGGGSATARTPVTAAASSFTEGATNELLSVNAAQRVLRKGLPSGYSEAADLVDSGVAEASDLYDKAEKRLEPAINSTKELTKSLLPKAEGILPKSVYEKIGGWADSTNNGSGSINADEETISSALGSIFTAQMEQDEQGKQEETIKDTLKEAKASARHEQSSKQLSLIQESMARLVGYQDRVTVAYQKKSLDLQFRHYFAARDLLKLQQASNADMITALNDIKLNTGLPDWVKTESSENFGALLQEKLMGGTVDTVGNYMTDFRSNLVNGVKNKVLDGVGGFADGLKEATEGVNSLMSAQEMMAEMNDGPKESAAVGAADMGGSIIGSSVADKLLGFMGDGLAKEGSKRKEVIEKGIRLQNWARGFDGDVKEFMDTTEDDGSAKGWFANFLRESMQPMQNSESVLQNLQKDATSTVPWDVLSRRTLIEIIPEYLARITQNTETMATGEAAEKMVYSKISEQMVTESTAVAEATDRFVKRTEISSYRESTDKLLDKLFKGTTVSAEARATMSEQIHADLNKGWNIDPRRYVTLEGFEDRLNRDAVMELIETFKTTLKAKNVGKDGKDDWEFGESEKIGNYIGDIGAKGRSLRGEVPEMQSAINEFVATGDKDLLRATGWIDSTSGKDKFNEERMTALMTGRLSLDDLESEYEANKLKAERGANATAWRQDDAKDWKGARTMSDAGDVIREQEVSAIPTPLGFAGADAFAELNKSFNTGDVEQLARLEEMVAGSAQTYEVNDKQLAILTEMRDLMIAQAMATAGSEDAELGKQLLAQFTSLSNWQEPKWYNSLASGIANGASAGAGMLGKYYSAIWGGATKATNFVTEKGSQALEFLGAKKDSIDVFITGKLTPALRGEFIKAGRYVDVTTGKVIKSLGDINGEVRDIATNNIVLSIEDFENGIYNDTGESILDKLGGGAKRLATGALDALGNYYGFLGDTAKKGINFITSKVTEYDRNMKNQCDVYVKNRMGDGPALLRTKLLRGAYFTKDGTPIYSIDGLNEPIYDEEGNMVLSDEDLSAGLVDPKGDEVKVSGLLGAGLGIAGMGLKFAGDVGSKAWDSLKGYYSGIGNMSKGFLETIKDGFNFGGFGEIANMNVTATNVYINGPVSQGNDVVGQVEAIAANATTKASEVADAFSDKVSKVSDVVKDKAETAALSTMVAGDKVADVMERLGDKVSSGDAKGTALKAIEAGRENLETRAAPVISHVAEKATKVKDTLLGTELGEDTVLIGAPDGTVSIKTPDGNLPAGDGSVKGYLASLLALMHRKDANAFGDTNGDGLRDGSWQDQADDVDPDAVDTAPEEAGGKGFDIKGKLAGLAGLFGLGGGDEDSGGGITDAITEGATEAAIGDMLDGGDGTDKKRGRKPKGAKPKGKFGRAWNAIKSGGGKLKEMAGNVKNRSLLGNVKAGFKGAAGAITGLGGLIKGLGGKVAGKAAASSGLKKAGLWAARGALGLVGGTLGAPIVGTALAAAGAAYTAYEVFGFFADRTGTEPLEEYRYLQYGLNPDDSTHRSFLRKLEDEAADSVRYSGQGGLDGSLVIKDVDWYSDFLEFCDIDPDLSPEEDPENAQRFASWMEWFKNRFEPVFLLHHGIARMVDKDIDLLDIDDEMDDEDKARFVERAYYQNDGSGMSPYLQVASPFVDWEVPGGYDVIDAKKDELIGKYKEDGKKKETKAHSYATGALGTVAVASTGYGEQSKKPASTKSSSAMPEKSTPSKAAAYATGALGVATAYSYTTTKPKSSGDNKDILGAKVLKPVGLKDVPVLTMLRAYLYGLSELTPSKVSAIVDLEAFITPDISQSSSFTRKEWRWSGNREDVWETFAGQFGFKVDNEEAKKRWMAWFTKRFIPVLCAWMAGLALVGSKDAVAPILTPNEELQIGENLIYGPDTPNVGIIFKGEEPVLMENKVDEILDYLEARETKQEDEVNLPSGASAGEGGSGIEMTGLTSSVSQATMDTVEDKTTTEKGSTAPASTAGTESTSATTPTSTPTKVKRTLTKAGSKGYEMPSEGRLSSPYGMRVHPIKGSKKFHGGIDIAAPVGTPIKASTGGLISRREYSKSYGNVIYVENDDGTHARYAHMQKFEPGYRVGDRVDKGAVIGYMGSTGWSTGSHLHFEVRKDSYDKTSTIDPFDLFKGKEANTAKAELKAAEAEAKDEKDVIGETTIEGSDTVASTATGKPTGDGARAANAAVNTPLVTPSLMTPTDGSLGKRATVVEEDTAITATSVEVDTASKPPMDEPFIKASAPPEKAKVEAEVLQQKRAQLSQETANKESARQLEAIGQVMTESLQVQRRMETLLTDVVKYTKATAVSAHAANSNTTDSKVATAEVTKPTRPTTGADLSAMMKSGTPKAVEYPLSMGRDS